MNIFGTGIDIVEVSRIKKLLSANGRFRKRVFTEGEIVYCEGKKKKYEHFAVRFAAKEAVWKALGNGGIALKSIEITNEAGGKPKVLIKRNLLGRGRKVIITLSHTDKYAVAQALVVD